MVDFVPFQMIATQPTAVDQVAMPSPEPSGPTKPFFSARCPIPRIIDLNTMDDGTLISGVIYRRDFFLCGPFEGGVQGLWLAANSGAGQQSFKIGLVDEAGKVIAALEQLAELPTSARLLLRLAAVTAARSLYLRVETQAQNALLYTTLDVTLDEVM